MLLATPWEEWWTDPCRLCVLTALRDVLPARPERDRKGDYVPEAGSDRAARRGVVPLIVTVIGAAVVALAAATWQLLPFELPEWWRPLVAAVVIAAGWRLQCSVRVGGDRVVFFWGDAAMVLATGLVAPAWIVVLTAPAVAVALGLLPGRQQPVKAAYNTAAAVLASGAGVAVLAAVGATPLRLDSARDVLGLGLAAVVYVVVCDVATSAVISRHTGRRFADVQREDRLLQVVSLLGNLGGAAAVWMTVATDPRLAVVAVLAVLGTQQGYVGLRRAQHERRRRQELAVAVSGLADANGSLADESVRVLVVAAGGDDLRAAETAVLRRAAELAAALFAADVVEIELATADAQGTKETACLPIDTPWLYRRWMRAAERSEVFGYRDAVQAGPAPDAVAQLATDGAESGELRLAFATAVTSVGLDERERADLATFAAAIPAAVQIARRQAVERQLRAQAEHQARHDALTGLANRRQLLDDTAAALAADASCVELTLLEVTGLRELAGTVGHAAADRLLVMVADRIAAAAGEGDVAARLEGGRFALASTAARAAGSSAADRLRAVLAAPVELPSGAVALTTVAGSAVTSAEEDAAELLRRAEVALAAAHEAPSRVARYDHAIDVESAPRMMLVTGLLEAIAAGRLHLGYQLARDLVTGEPRSVEAVPSWGGSAFGSFTADDLLDLVGADVPGLQAAYLDWLLSTALQDRRGWERQGVGVPVAVRLPRRSLLDPALPRRVSEALAAAEIPADQLIVSVDDALPTARLLDVTEVVTSLAGRGILIAVDRLSMIEQIPILPVSELRLPADLVSQVPFSDRAAALVAGTIATATRLGLHTTARGVDSDAHATALRDMGCSAGQGEHVALTVEGVKAGRYLWATGLLSEALHPPADVVVLARQRERRRRTT